MVLKRKYRWSIVASCTVAGGGDQAQPTLPHMASAASDSGKVQKGKGSVCLASCLGQPG